MTKEELLSLYKQWSNDTMFLSYHKIDHPAYIELKNAGQAIIPFILERLKDSIDHDGGFKMDRDNCPWLSTCLLGDITNGECFSDFPEKHSGRLNEIRSHLLKWGKDKGLI
jgi:hypothetical protein